MIFCKFSTKIEAQRDYYDSFLSEYESSEVFDIGWCVDTCVLFRFNFDLLPDAIA